MTTSTNVSFDDTNGKQMISLIDLCLLYQVGCTYLGEQSFVVKIHTVRKAMEKIAGTGRGPTRQTTRLSVTPGTYLMALMVLNLHT